MTIAEDIAAALTTAGYSNLRALEFTDSPDAQIGIFYGGGTVLLATGGDIETPKVQIQVRDTAANAKTCEERAIAIRDLLHRKTDVSNSFNCIWDGAYPRHWKDDNGRHIFAVEFKLSRVIT